MPTRVPDTRGHPAPGGPGPRGAWRRRGVSTLLVLGLLAFVWIPSADAQDQAYRIGPDDVLKITVWGQDDLTRTGTVSADGTFPSPLLGPVPAAGLTPAQFESRLKELLGKDYLVDPQVSVTIQEYRSQRVFVLGEAKTPGVYPLTGPTTLLDMLSRAGGQTPTAGGHVSITRPSADGVAPAQLRVDLKQLFGGDRAANLVLQHGDTVYIAKMTSFFVAGEVKKPGVYQLDPGTTAFGGLTLAGGVTERAAATQGQLIRRLASGEEQTMLVDLSGTDPRARDLLLQDGDTLLIPAGNLIFVLGEVSRPGALPLDRSLTAMDAILLAGGFTPRAAAVQVKLTRRLPSGEEQARVLDLSGPNASGRDASLAAGDTLIVPTGNMVYVLGEVKSPGAFPVSDTTTAIQAIAMAGGFTDRAAPNRTKVIRTHKDGRQETLVVDLNEVIKRGRKDKDVPLASNDVIVVPESYF